MITLKKIETILHPVRFKIIQRFLDGQTKTAKILAKELKDIPQATLYRQLEALVRADILTITEENPIRGTVEKVYTLNGSNSVIKADDVKTLSNEEHLQYFLLFTAGLAKDFENYLSKSNIDFEKDGVGYRQTVFHLSDEEFIHFVQEISTVFQKYSTNNPSKDRTKRLISTIIMPDIEGRN